jgi:hemerythrin
MDALAGCTADNFITWSERYSVGVARMDREHQRLFDLVNELYAAILGDKEQQVLSSVLDGVATYTVTHFTSEEALMRQHGYPAYPQHRAEHQKLVARVERLRKEMRAGKPALSREVMTFLQDWLLNHIIMMDRKYAGHLNAAGVK